MEWPESIVTKLLVALGIAISLLGSLRQLNAALMSVTSGAGRSAVGPLALASMLALAAAIAWFASSRARHHPTPRLVATTLLGIVAVGYAAFLVLVPVHRFGGAATGRPFEVIEESYPRRGTHTYRLNRFGFRGSEWPEERASGTTRGVVIGDSMVFGSGVDDADTIDLPFLSERSR